MTETGASEAVIDYISAADWQSFPGRAIEQSKIQVLDSLGVMLAGSASSASRILREEIQSYEGRAEASTLGEGAFRAPVALAALANGTSGHAHDYDDTQLSTTPDRIFGLLTHPTVPALAASLAIGEARSISGKELLTAVLVGVEVECKIAEAIDPSHYEKGFHSSATIGTFGAAASTAKLVGLSREALGHCLGIAVSSASGIRANFGTMTKPLHVGRATENGVRATLLASRGYTADAAGLDGRWGFFQVFSHGAEAPAFDPERIVGRLGNPLTLLDPGVSIKPYPCGCLGHPTMDAMRGLVIDNDVSADAIERVRVRAGSNILNPLRYKTAQNELEAKFCIPFMMSAIALRRKAGIQEFSDDFVRSEPVQSFMERVETVFDEAIERQGADKMRSVVEVQMKNGRLLTREAGEYRGGPALPLSREELVLKFNECASEVLSEERIETAVARVEELENLESLEPLMEILCARS